MYFRNFHKNLQYKHFKIIGFQKRNILIPLLYYHKNKREDYIPKFQTRLLQQHSSPHLSKKLWRTSSLIDMLTNSWILQELSFNQLANMISWKKPMKKRKNKSKRKFNKKSKVNKRYFLMQNQDLQLPNNWLTIQFATWVLL